MTNRTIIAIPCFNCEKQIARVLSDFTPDLVSRIDEIVIIDNRSQDDTVKVAFETMRSSAFGSKLTVLVNEENYGLGGSHKVAYQYALSQGAQWLGFIHGDHQARTEELHLLLDVAQKNTQFTAILGARFMESSSLSGYSKIREWGNRALNWVYTLLTWRRTFDMGSGLNLFRMDSLGRLPIETFSDGFTFNMDLLLALYRSRQKILFLPITWSESDQISNAKTFRVGWIALKTVLRWRFSTSEKPTLRPTSDYKSKKLALDRPVPFPLCSKSASLPAE